MNITPANGIKPNIEKTSNEPKKNLDDWFTAIEFENKWDSFDHEVELPEKLQNPAGEEFFVDEFEKTE